MKRTILALVSSLAIILALSACSDLKKEVAIRTIGGERMTLSIKVPKKFKEGKELYFWGYTYTYMEAWNEGVNESGNRNNEYKFNTETFALTSLNMLQVNMFLAQDRMNTSRRKV